MTKITTGRHLAVKPTLIQRLKATTARARRRAAATAAQYEAWAATNTAWEDYA